MKKMLAGLVVGLFAVLTPMAVTTTTATAAPAPVQVATPKHTPIIPNWCYLYRDQYGRNHWVCIR